MYRIGDYVKINDTVINDYRSAEGYICKVLETNSRSSFIVLDLPDTILNQYRQKTGFQKMLFTENELTKLTEHEILYYVMKANDDK